MGDAVEQEMDQLLAALDGAGPGERKQLRVELARLNRQKVVTPRHGWDRADWAQLPAVSFRRRTCEPEDLNQLIKIFLRVAVGGAGEVAAARGGELQFVGLVRLTDVDGGARISLKCPYEQPIRLMMGMQDASTTNDPQVRASILRDLLFKCNIVGDIEVPVVFVFSPASDSVLLMNQNHFSDPDQFLDPALCRTTSGFLNFIGASNIKGSMTTIVQNLEPLMNKGLDEWFRWLYCTIETGVSFDPERVLVRRSNPEEWVYDYDGQTDTRS